MEIKSLKDEAYTRIREMVMNGVLNPGDRLAEIPLGKSLGIGRTPVREAIGRLVAEGIAEYAPSGGAYVKRFSPEDVSDFYEVRELVETYSIRKITGRNDRVTIVQLHDTVDALKQIYDEFLQCGGAAETLAKLKLAATAHDLQFHSIIAKGSGNKFLVKMASDFNIINNIVLLRRAQTPDSKLGVYLAGIRDVHASILAAVEERDPDLAAERLSRHILGAKLDVMDEFKATNGAQGNSLVSEIQKIISQINT